MKSIIFNSGMVRAILEGRKTMTRRVIKPQPFGGYAEYQGLNSLGNHLFYSTDENDDGYINDDGLRDSPYQVGEEIFVKESFAYIPDNYLVSSDLKNGNIIYKTHEHCCDRIKWKPAQYMKQEHSRIALEITNIKVERLQDISEEDAIKEGFFADGAVYYDGNEGKLAVDKFQIFWQSIYKNGPIKNWQANPFVWAIEFKRVNEN